MKQALTFCNFFAMRIAAAIVIQLGRLTVAALSRIVFCNAALISSPPYKSYSNNPNSNHTRAKEL